MASRNILELLIYSCLVLKLWCTITYSDYSILNIEIQWHEKGIYSWCSQWAFTIMFDCRTSVHSFRTNSQLSYICTTHQTNKILVNTDCISSIILPIEKHWLYVYMYSLYKLNSSRYTSYSVAKLEMTLSDLRRKQSGQTALFRYCGCSLVSHAEWKNVWY